MTNQPRSLANDIALVSVFAAIIAAFSLIPAIAIGGIGVPITLQTLGVVLAGLVLGPWRGALATLLYLAIGFAGLPVFAGFTSGIAVFSKPSIGYLLSFPLVALVAGAIAAWAIRRGSRLTYLWLVIAGLVATVFVNHPLGIFGMSRMANLSLQQAFLFDLPFWPGDVIKVVAAAAVAVAVHKAFPALLARRSPATS